MKAVDQGLRLRIDRGIELLIGMAVARQEALEPQHVGIVGAADDDRAAGPGFDQADPAQDQGPHDALADFGLADKQRPQPLGRQDEGADLGHGLGVDQGGPAGQLGELAEEGAGPIRDDPFAMAELIAAGDFDLPGQDDDEPRADLAAFGHRLAGSKAADLAEAQQAFDLHRVELGKSVVVAGIEDGRLGAGHGSWHFP